MIKEIPLDLTLEDEILKKEKTLFTSYCAIDTVIIPIDKKLEFLRYIKGNYFYTGEYFILKDQSSRIPEKIFIPDEVLRIFKYVLPKGFKFLVKNLDNYNIMTLFLKKIKK